MKLVVNGQESDIAAKTIAEVVAALGYQGHHFAVALNMTHIPHSQYAEVSLKTGDEIEILMPMQGG